MQTMTQEEKRARDAKYMREHRSKHRERYRAYSRKYYYTHREEMQASHRRYCEEHKEELQAYEREYRQSNADQIRERHREYAKTDRGRMLRVRSQARRDAVQAGLPSTLTEQQWQSALTHFGNLCAYCGVQDGPLQQDHVVPLSLGGGYVASNIVPACKSCNSSKSNMPLSEWVVGRGAAFVLPDLLERVSTYLDSTEVSQ